MGSFGCCVIWAIIGLILGWLLHHFFGKCCRKNKDNQIEQTPPAAKLTSTPATTVAPEKKPAAKTTKPKAVAKPKTTKSKTATAKTSTTKKSIDLTAAKAAGIKIKNATDLTVIEGIGPKIDALFKENGLKTLADIGSATVTQMRAILDKGGARYRMANPSTWAKQAKLAANNKWAELKKLQDELSGGKKK